MNHPYPNPLIPGFNPDPSVVNVNGDYYLITSTFEYMPGIPVYRSTNFRDWVQIGNVITRDEQAALTDVPSGGGAWAPTIRHRDGVFHVIVTLAMGRGCVLYTAEDPAGPWSDPTPIGGVLGIDPDLAWDEDGTAVVTYSGLDTTAPAPHRHQGIQQARVDLATGRVLERPRSLWSGTGLKFPEAPHLYRIGDWWYLVIAEGGTERGHSVSVARGTSPFGPFEGHPDNPVLSARSTDAPIQNTGHGDLVRLDDGSWRMVLLGMRPLGLSQAFSALGRETFSTAVTWEQGWPVIEPLVLAPAPPRDEPLALTSDAGHLAPSWIAVRREPESFATLDADGLILTGSGAGLDSAHPSFLGRRQSHQMCRFAATVDVTGGAGGIGIRIDEEHHIEIEAEVAGQDVLVTARVRLSTISQEWTAVCSTSTPRLIVETLPTPPGRRALALSSDIIRLGMDSGGIARTLAEVDGRYLTAETAASFTGRVVGLHARSGRVRFSDIDHVGTEPT